MIIWGSRSVTSTVNRGRFFCPSCRQQQAYSHRRMKRFFTLYFIPLIPMNTLGEYIECDACKDTYKEAVLSYDPDAEKVKFEADFRMVLQRVVLGLAAEVRDPRSLEVARGLCQQMTGVDPDHLPAVTDSLDRIVETELTPLAGRLSDQGKETIMKAACTVAAAPIGRIDDSTSGPLTRIARRLQISDAHLKGIMAEVA
jgi:zinc-ribbon family